MTPEQLSILIPSVGFFLFFFLGFLIVEMTIVILLNRLFFRYWGIASVPLDYPSIKNNSRTELAFSFLIAILITTYVLRSRVIEVLLGSNVGVRLFALQAFLGMLLIYLITTHLLVRNDLVKKIHKYTYFFISSVALVATLLFVDQQFTRLQDYLQVNLIRPYIMNRTLTLENHLREELLTSFRHKIGNHACPWVDFSTPDHLGRIQNMVYVTTQNDLDILDRPVDRKDPMEFLSGWLCSDPRADFLLTIHGEWYWVMKG